MPTLTDKIGTLLREGKSPKEVAAALGTTEDYARAVKGRLKMAIPMHLYRARKLDRTIRKLRHTLHNLKSVRSRRIKSGKKTTKITLQINSAEKAMARARAKRAAYPSPRSYCKPRRPEVDQAAQP